MTGSKPAPARWQADLSLAIVALVWGSTFVVVKRALDDISTMYFLALRFALASACLYAIFFPAFRQQARRERALGHYAPEDHRPTLLGGFKGGVIAGLFLWLGYILQTFGLKYTTAGNSGFLTGLYIVLVPLISAAVYRRWPQPRELAGIVIAGAGMVLLTLPSLDRTSHVNSSHISPSHLNPGDLLTLGCAVAFAFHLLFLGYYSQREPFQAVALGQIACAAFLSAVSLLFEAPRATWGAGVIFAIVLTAVFATALAFALQTWGQQYTTPTRTALIFALEPVFALVTAVLVGGEALTRAAVIGGALILTGILAVEMKPAASS